MAWKLVLSCSSLKPFPLQLPPTPSMPNLSCRPNNPQCRYNGTRSFSNGRSLGVRGPITQYHAQNKNSSRGGGGVSDDEVAQVAVRRAQQVALWVAEAVYVVWLFLLPYAPGDPVWAIKSSTINDLIGLSLNFFYVLPILNYV